MTDTQVRETDTKPEVAGTAAPVDALHARLQAIDLPQGGPLAAARADALSRLQAMGLPKPRDEYWRYTDPAPFNAPRPKAVAIDPNVGDTLIYDGLAQTKLVFVDGKFDAAASDAFPTDGVELARLDDAPDWAVAQYGTMEARGQSPVARPFATLNTLAAREGIVLRVTGKLSQPIHIIHRRTNDSADVNIHHLIRMEPGSEATVIESGLVGARSNIVVEAEVLDGARLHMISNQRATVDKVGISHIFARVADKALFKSFILTVSGRMMRNEAFIEIAGDDSVAHVAGAVLGDSAEGEFHHDDTIFITHAAERCESRQVFKKVLKNGAVGVFQGKILVKPGAQKTDGYQISQALLLDESSQFLAKPELEIYADDVKCSHGSTTGAIDETALYYLRSRGVPKDRAIVLLVLSFLADALAEIDDDDIRDRITARLDDWLVGHASDRVAQR
ncbi:MAG: Fe-S cluster assembly protein SufD [Paracoccus denitrificans]|nr:MAG: Fe-S cluster assembly protein SufD [Paracoccus denitrificans]PZO83723.1 MAG: Fe-S cluster assembly protein SufD [Paracoccus denitrificans]